MSPDVADAPEAKTELSPDAATVGWLQFKRGQGHESLATLRAALEIEPENADLVLVYGRVLGHLRDEAAEPTLRRAIELGPSAAGWHALAEFLMSVRRTDEAGQAYETALALDPNSVWALVGLGELRSRQRRYAESYQLMDRARLLAPKDPKIISRFSRTLLDQSVRLATLALEFNPDLPQAAWVLQRARNAFGEDAGQETAGAVAPQQRRPAIWPRWQTDFAEFDSIIRRSVLPGSFPPAPILGPGSRVATFGSCFAEHLANALSGRGLRVHFQKRQETSDNLFSARRHLEELARDPQSAWAAHFRNLDLFVISLGVAASFFDPQTGENVLVGGEEKALAASRYVFRMMSVGENVAHLRAMLDHIKVLSPSAAIVLTVSPVPLAATFERASAVQADAVSKSTMRLAAEAVMQEQRPNVYYWPSFEIVRWLGAHIAPHHPPIFGVEDNASRHVSKWAVDVIIGLFLEKFAEGLEGS